MSGEPCVLCGKPVSEPVLQVTPEGMDGTHTPRTFTLLRCNSCGLVMTAPRTAFLERFRREGRLLDVGCGLGLFLLALDPARWERYGLEVMPAAHQEAARRLGADRIVTAELTAAEFPPEHFDVVTFWDALEHLPDPVRALNAAFRLLRPGGLALLRLPNFAGYAARRFRQDWYELAIPYHAYHFTPATLARALEATGFEVRAL